MIFEENTRVKNPLNIDIRVASCYPNIYRTAMSSLGYQIIYGMINDREDSWCERVIYPSSRSIESNSPLIDFDIISFTIHYEEDYFNLLKMLKSGQIPIDKNKRDNSYPLIIAGGPCATSNPLPISQFVDMFIIGEAEVMLNNVLDLYKELKNPKEEIANFLEIHGVYIPNHHVKRGILRNMDKAYHITNPIITKTENKEYLPVFSNSILLNISRGCTRGCRFCMSGYVYRPIRETSINKLIKIAIKSRESTGLNKISLIGFAASDYSKIDQLISKLRDLNFQISTPSLRIETINPETLQNLAESGLKTITLAPESIYSLRKSLNKNIHDAELYKVIEDTISLNFNIKLYYLIGIMNETNEDIKELSEHIKYINSLKNNKNNGNKSIKFSVNPLIPKPHTPLQWESYDIKDIKRKIKYLRNDLKNITIKFDSAKMGLIQYVLSTKGSEVGDLIKNSIDYNNNQNIILNQWKKYNQGYKLDDELPWDEINVGINKNFLIQERQKILNHERTPWCKNNCYQCGSC
ncbi:radical SAM protein [Methanobrevibacter filiformis]|uniref:Radical SAM superfamily protein n=1 Tax=Methanobrevibacter filiformis TaxID=55758 RepID=A0A165ZD46_9EURY|nr:radical SAM protein [Methanobrevibacter filiformis]KZX10558.1 radical SAM superfamily protein [Methanobrevibacter filiformis]